MTVTYKQNKSGKQGEAMATFSNGFWTLQFSDDGSIYNVPQQDVPLYLKENGKYWFQLNGDGTRAYKAAPPSGTKVMPIKYSRMYTMRESDTPAPFLQSSADGYQMMKFAILMKVQPGVSYADFELPYYIPYAFQPAPDGGVYIDGKGKKACMMSLDLLGADWTTDDLVMCDNLLPQLDAILRSKNVSLAAITEKSYVKELRVLETIADIPQSDEEKLMNWLMLPPSDQIVLKHRYGIEPDEFEELRKMSTEFWNTGMIDEKGKPVGNPDMAAQIEILCSSILDRQSK